MIKIFLFLFISSLSFSQSQSGFWGWFNDDDVALDSVPVAPYNLVAAANGTGGIVLTWGEYGDDLNKTLVYRNTSTNPTTLNDSVNAGVLTLTQNSLTDGTAYFYRLKLRDDAGQLSDYSLNASDTVYSQQVVYVDSVGAETDSSATLYGRVDPNGAALTTRALWGLTSSYTDSAIVSQSPVSGISPTAVSYAITDNLSSSTLYHYTFSTIQVGGRYIKGADSTFTTTGAEEVVYPGTYWAYSSMSAEGMDSSKVMSVMASMDYATVIKDGNLVYQKGDTTSRRDYGSAVKPIYSYLLFNALEEGIISDVTDKVKTYVGGYSGKDTNITFFHYGHMESAMGITGENPGEKWAYNDSAITRYRLAIDSLYSTGATTLEIIASDTNRLALGFQTDIFDDNDFLATTRDMARIGWLFANEFKWRNSVYKLPDTYYDTYIKNNVTNSLKRSGVFSSSSLTNQWMFGQGIYGWNVWVNDSVKDMDYLMFPDCPSDMIVFNGHWTQEIMIIVPSLGLVVVGDGNWSNSFQDFEPGTESNTMAKNVKLLCEAAGWISTRANGTYHIPIVFDTSKVAGSTTLTKFPVHLEGTALHGNQFWNTSPAQDDIYFTKANSTVRLPHFFTSYSLADSTFSCDIRIDSTKETVVDTLWVHFGNSVVSTGNNFNTYSEYTFATDFEDNPADTLLDLTINDLDGSPVNLDAGDLLSGQTGNSWYFDSTAYVTLGQPYLLSFPGGNTLYISAWTKRVAEQGCVFSKYESTVAGDRHIQFSHNLSTTAKVFVRAGGQVTGTTTIDTIFTSVGMRNVDYTADSLMAYYNGVRNNPTAAATSLVNTNTKDVLIGAVWNTTNPSFLFKGRIDRLRVQALESNGDYGEVWIGTEYNVVGNDCWTDGTRVSN